MFPHLSHAACHNFRRPSHGSGGVHPVILILLASLGNFLPGTQMKYYIYVRVGQQNPYHALEITWNSVFLLFFLFFFRLYSLWVCIIWGFEIKWNQIARTLYHLVKFVPRFTYIYIFVISGSNIAPGHNLKIGRCGSQWRMVDRFRWDDPLLRHRTPNPSDSPHRRRERISTKHWLPVKWKEFQSPEMLTSIHIGLQAECTQELGSLRVWSNVCIRVKIWDT